MNELGMQMVVIWGLSALGVYHLLQWMLKFARRRSGRFSRPYAVTANRPDSAEQLRTVMGANFTARKVMSLSEYGVFKAAEDEVRLLRGGYRVFAQTSLGEVLQSGDKIAHSAINSKRVDVLIISAAGYPVVAIEYQGAGHYQSDAAARDAVKKEALRKAGVAYVEISESYTGDETRELIRRALVRREDVQAGVHRRAS